MSVPAHLYKYRALTQSSRDHTISQISKSEVFFSPCSSFNDPFDCRINVRGSTQMEATAMVKASNSMGILCLSEANDNLLMWSHYSDSHKGVCIEYATSDKELFGCELTKVRYSKKYPRFAETKGFDLETTRRYLSTKSSHWKHEREWRIFYHGLGVQTFPGKELSAVYLGCVISPEDRDEIIEVVRQRPTKARVYQASLDSESFRLRMEPLDTQTPTR